jgi:thiol-disulfide isomerase/thioredoxin
VKTNNQKAGTMKTYIVLSLILTSILTASAQEISNIQLDIREMIKETNPGKSIALKEQIISKYKLEQGKDAEIIDLLNGNVAIAYLKNRKYIEFESYIDKIENKFNQTSMLNMAAIDLLNRNTDLEYANKIAKETINRFMGYKDDPNAKPATFSKEDWQRFMNFAQYPYYDTYAHTWFALEKYEEAMYYQRLAFEGAPEEGMPASTERYAKLLELNGDKDGAKKFLLKIAALGKLNKGMINQLESFYVAENDGKENFDQYLNNLLTDSKNQLIEELKNSMLSKPAPEFTLSNLRGERVSLSDYRGKIVIIDLWATWCAPCIASFPAMQQQVIKYPDVEFLFIAVDEKGKDVEQRVKNFINKKEYSFHVLLDEPIVHGTKDYKIISSYQPNGIPAKYFIDKSGIIRFETKGFSTDTELTNEIDAIISVLNSL